MKKSRFTEAQIVAILKQVEGGRTVKEVCRELVYPPIPIIAGAKCMTIIVDRRLTSKDVREIFDTLLEAQVLIERGGSILRKRM